MGSLTPILSEDDYNRALARMDKIFHADVGTPEGDERDALFDLIEAYEDEHYPIGLPSVIDAIAFQLSERRLTPNYLVPLLGSPQKVSAVLSGKQDITMPMARALHKHLGISAEILLQEPAAVSRRGDS